jgi:hypothetical protein
MKVNITACNILCDLRTMVKDQVYAKEPYLLFEGIYGNIIAVERLYNTLYEIDQIC